MRFDFEIGAFHKAENQLFFYVRLVYNFYDKTFSRITIFKFYQKYFKTTIVQCNPYTGHGIDYRKLNKF